MGEEQANVSPTGAAFGVVVEECLPTVISATQFHYPQVDLSKKIRCRSKMEDDDEDRDRRGKICGDLEQDLT